MTAPNVYRSPDEAIDALASRLAVVSTERVSLGEAAGRTLAADLAADRDSPAADVSAMDGYALRAEDLDCGDELPVRGESAPGHAPPEVLAGAAMRIFTGGVVPRLLDLVVRREDVEEAPRAIRLTEAARRAGPGENIRRQGENAAAGSPILAAGTALHGGGIAAAANFGAVELEVFRPVRVAILVTGDELQPPGAAVEPWQLRDSNGPTLAALLGPRRWLEVAAPQRVPDQPAALQSALQQALADSDAVILSGGVSMGDHDYVPDAILHCGGEIVFHRLPIRPAKPILGAVTPRGQLILGLPGNPVSAAVGAVRFALPLLGRLAGRSQLDRLRPTVLLDDPGDRTLPLTWYRLVRLTGAGRAELVRSLGSGDLVSMAHSDGFTEQPPDTSGAGPWPFWSWFG